MSKVTIEQVSSEIKKAIISYDSDVATDCIVDLMLEYGFSFQGSGKMEERRKVLNLRRIRFYKELVDYAKDYPAQMLRAFYDYWSEPNRSYTKMKCEIPPTWNTKLRLNTWSLKNNITRKKDKKIITPFSEEFMKEHWGRWKNYKFDEFKFAYFSYDSEQEALNELVRISFGDMEEAADIIKKSIASGWKSFVPVKKDLIVKDKTEKSPVHSGFEGLL